jgi:hypothetical protein
VNYLADYRQLQALQVMRRIHPLMKDANNRDAVVGSAEINHMPLDIAAAIARSNMIARWSGLRRFGQHLEGAAVSKSVYRSACSSPHSRRVYFQMPSRSRSAAGESRYSAMYAAEPTLEGVCIEALWLSASVIQQFLHSIVYEILPASRNDLLFNQLKTTPFEKQTGCDAGFRVKLLDAQIARDRLEVG